MSVRSLALLPLALVVALAACGDDATRPAIPSDVQEVSGSAQDGVVGTPLLAPLVVRVVDAQGQPFPGAQVAWDADDDGSVDPASGTTDAQGTAQTTWVLGPAAGSHTARAVVADVGTVTFTASAVAGQVATVTLAPDTLTLDEIGSQGTLTASFADQFGNPIADEAVLEWSSLDPSIASVDDAGVVTSESVGVTRIAIAAGESADTAVVVARETVGADGGTFAVAGGQVQVTVPPGALSDGVAITVEALEAEELTAGTIPGTAYRFSPSGTQFAQPVRVEIAYDADVVPTGTAQSRLRMQRRSGDSWEFVEGSGAQPADGIVTAELSSFSVYGVGVGPAFVQVAAGMLHVCALDDEGRAFCWGANGGGRLGTGDEEPRTMPTPVVGGHVFSSIHVADTHSCGRTSGGRVYCWGGNARGQLGNGAAGSVSVPTEIAGGHTFDAVAISLWNGCGLTSGGAVYCWGANHVGQIGAETTDACAAGQNTLDCTLSPVRLDGDWSFSSIDVGLSYVCGVQNGGVPYCWGSNGFSQAGGPTGNLDAPRQVPGGQTFASVVTGAIHSCGMTADGSVHCWGRDFDVGNMGDGEFGNTHTEPVQVADGRRFVSLAVANTNSVSSHVCGLKADGSVFCWGANATGQLGTETPVACEMVGNTFQCSPSPVQVDTDLSFASIAVAASVSCATTPDGEIRCWGHNTSGQQGIGTTSDGGPAPVRALFPWESPPDAIH